MSSTLEKFFNLDNFLRLAISIGIIIGINVFIQLGSDSIFPQISRENFCPSYDKLSTAQTKEQCVLIKDSVWNENNLDPYYTNESKEQLTTITKTGYCKETSSCQEEFEEATNINKSKLFVLEIILSLLIFIFSFVIKTKPLNTTLAWSGVFSVLFSLSDIPNDNKLLVSFSALLFAIVLIFLLSKKKIKKEL